MPYDIKSVNSHWLLYLIPIFMGTVIYAAKCGFILLAVVEWMVIMTSIYYWSNYTSNTRRSIDIAVVQLALYIHLYYAIKYKSIQTIYCYILLVLFYFIGRMHNSDVAHIFVWIFGALGSIFLIKHLCEINKHEDICLRDNFCKKKINTKNK